MNYCNINKIIRSIYNYKAKLWFCFWQIAVPGRETAFQLLSNKYFHHLVRSGAGNNYNGIPWGFISNFKRNAYRFSL